MDVRGRFRPHPRGFGFLNLVADDGATPREAAVARDGGGVTTDDRAFVPPPLARGLVADDLVDATLEAGERGLQATRLTVVTRPRRMLVGTLTNGPGRLVLEPEPSTGSGWIRLADTVAESLRRAVGRVVVLLRSEDEHGAPLGAALVAGPFVAGSPQAVRAAAAVVALERATPGLIPGGPAAVGLDPASTATTHARFVGLLAGGRRGAAAGLDASGPIPGAALVPVDRSGETCVTIDAASARDLDDAIAAGWDGQASSSVHVAVHIADAAGAVGIGSDADRYARIVAATAYLAIGDNAPMLDPALSEGRLSLLAGEPRDVLSVRFDVTPDGRTEHVLVELAQITSRARLTYAAVERWLDGDHTAVHRQAGEGAPAADELLGAVMEASRRLGVERDARATFEELFAAPELTPALVDGRLTVVEAEPDAHAYRLVERLMVAANEAVAGHLAQRGVPALYRAHTGLDHDRVDRLRAAATLAGAHVPALDVVGPDQAPPDQVAPGDPQVETEEITAQLLAEIDRLAAAGDHADRDLLVAAATSSTARASYHADPRRHGGLASSAYTHFTSPIRRYADLVVHRQLRATLAGEPPPYEAAELTGLARWLDARGGALAHLEARERNDLWALLLDRGLLDAEEPATIVELTANGLRVRLPRLGVSGFVTAERALGLTERARLQVDEHGLTTTSGPWRVGARVPVRFVGLDDGGRTVWRLGRVPRDDAPPVGSTASRDPAPTA